MVESLGSTPGLADESAEDLYEDAPCGYVSYLPFDGLIVRANRTFSRWTGYPAAELVKVKRFKDLLSAAGRIVHGTRHAPLLQSSGTAEAITLELVRTDGSRFPVLITSVVKRNAAGAPALIRTTVFDATAYQRYEKGLVEARDRAERAEAEARRALVVAEAADLGKVRFLAAMSHEFRSPISIVVGFADLLLGDAKSGRSGAKQIDYLNDINLAARHLLEMVEDATRFAGLDELGRTLRKQAASLGRLVEAGLRLAGPALEKTGATAGIETADEIEIFVDSASIVEALACVLREVSRLAPRGSALQLTWHIERGTAAIEVRCAGLFLRQATLDALLSPLGAAEVYHRGLEGAGLGIAVAERIVQIHGGRFQIRGGEGEGTVVLIQLPAA